MNTIHTIPAFPGGVQVDGVYNAGPMLADDQRGPTPEDALMRMYTGASDEHMAQYAALLEQAGYADVTARENGAYHVVSGQKDGVLAYAYLTKATGVARVIAQPLTPSLWSASDGAAGDGGEEICQYALYYDPINGHSPTTTNCGMFYMIRLADGSLFLIDGGHALQCSREAVSGMRDFMRSFTGVPEGQKVRIAGWFFTHAHSDHMAACIRLLRTYPQDFQLERVYFNFPSCEGCDHRCEPESFILKQTLREYAPGVCAVKLHSGMTFTLAGTGFEVLYTHEDAVLPEHPTLYPLRDFNCTSTILKMTTRSGGTVMWLGDTNTETQEIAMRTVPGPLWKSDVVQVAHHCFNYLSDLYPAIDADYAMLPNSHYGGHGHEMENEPKRLEVVACLSSPDNLWYEDETTIFRFERGAYRAIKTLPRVGGEHDGTDLFGQIL